MEITRVFCLVVIMIALFVQCNARDPYDAPSSSSPPGPTFQTAPPPPSRVAGLTRPPQQIQCLKKKSSCFNETLVCPSECPQRVPSDPSAKGCFADCGPKCEATCRTWHFGESCVADRKPNCNGFGALCYDPRFVGGDGIMFYFHGKSNQDFALVSDNDLQINAHFIGRRPEGRTRDFTWVQSLGIMFGTHTFTVGAKKVSEWDTNVDQFFFTFDDRAFTIPRGHESIWNASSTARLTVERTSQCNSVNVFIDEMVELSISVVPITKEDDRVHRYQIPSDNCFAHLEIQLKYFNPSAIVEGVLGQTYRPDFKNPVKVGVPMPIMGGEDKYKTSSLVAADCKSCIFKPYNSVSHFESLLVESTAATFDCASKVGGGA
ncbi:hypothetical protein KI387_033019, partial [Taxus chinensis]